MTPKNYPQFVRCHLCEFQIPSDIIDPSHPLFGTIDHIIPRSAGGTNTAENRAPAHRVCNYIKSSRPLSDAVRKDCTLAAARALSRFSTPETKRWAKDRKKVESLLNVKLIN